MHQQPASDTTAGSRHPLWREARSALAGLQQLFKQSPGFVAVLTGPEHVFEFVNDAFHRFSGHRDVLGKSMREALPEMVEQGFIDLLDRAYQTGETFEGHRMQVLLAREDGAPSVQRCVDFVHQPMRDDDGQVIGIFVQGFDVTEHEHLARELRESEARFRAITNAMPQIVWSARPDGYHDYFNERYYEFTGLSDGSGEGAAWIDLYPSEDRERIERTWRHSLRTGKPYEIEYRLRHHTGEYRWVLGRALPVTDAQGRITRWMGTCTDIHDQVLARELLHEDARRKDEFLAMLAHELRNPLAPIRTSAALLSTAGSDPGIRAEIAEIIARQAAHMTRLVDDLLDVSRVTRGVVRLEVGTEDMADLVRFALEQAGPLIDARSHAVDLELPERPMPVRADRTRMVQVIGNLLNNAAKFTPKGGKIKVTLASAGREAVVSVHDNGSGIAADLVPRVFDLFAQGTPGAGVVPGGLGIGLALARSIIELHGGTIGAYSDGQGRGSRFQVRMPLVSAGSDVVPAAPGTYARPAPCRVVVVDDNVDAARTTALLLHHAGHRVTVFNDGRSALAGLPGDADVYLIDIGLPDMSGLDLAKRLRQDPRTAEATLIAVTGYGSAADRRQSELAGFDAHLVKPLDVNRLREILDDIGQCH